MIGGHRPPFLYAVLPSLNFNNFQMRWKWLKINIFSKFKWVILIIAVDSDNRDLLDFFQIHTNIFSFSVRFESFLTNALYRSIRQGRPGMMKP